MLIPRAGGEAQGRAALTKAVGPPSTLAGQLGKLPLLH